MVLYCTKKVHIQIVGIQGGRDTKPSTGARRRMILGHLNLLIYQIYPPVLLFLFMLLLLLCFLLPSSFPTLSLSIKSENTTHENHNSFNQKYFYSLFHYIKSSSYQFIQLYLFLYFFGTTSLFFGSVL